MKLNRYTVYPGRHAFELWGRVWEPPCIKRKVQRIEWVVRFDETARYELPGREQEDWNKGGGWSFFLHDNHIESAMWSWRYAPDRDSVELGAYCHVGANVVKGMDEGSEVITRLKLKQSVTITLHIHYDRYIFRFRLEGSEEAAICIITHNHDRIEKLGRSIGLWFGGKNDKTKEPTPAPQRIDIYLTRKID